MPNEVVLFKIKFTNTGLENWPSTTSLYQINYSKYSAFKDEKISLKAGECKSGYYKYLEVSICAPKEAGTFTYDFQMGTDLKSLFGEVVQITLIVEEEEMEEPEVREEDPDDLDIEPASYQQISAPEDDEF